MRAELFGAAVPIPDAAQVFALTPGQQAAFLEFFDHPAQSAHKPHERIYRSYPRP